jgi:hypothetical protein
MKQTNPRSERSPQTGRGAHPACYASLLTALDQGWRIVDVVLVPVRDRSELLYTITMQHPGEQRQRELVLPSTPLTENLLQGTRELHDTGALQAG